MRKKHKKVCTTLSHVEQLLYLVSAFRGCVSTSPTVLLVGIHIGTVSFALGFKICTRAAVIKK